jgi:hypothetical protein
MFARATWAEVVNDRCQVGEVTGDWRRVLRTWVRDMERLTAHRFC